MEVHTNGWPQHLPEAALKNKLDPVMAKLSIPSHAFSCYKPRGQKWANLTFLHVAHGQVFLKEHGEACSLNPFSGNRRSNRPRRRARLQVMGWDIFCRISKERGNPNAPPKQPNPITLRGLQHAAEEEVRPTYRVKREGHPEVFDVRSLSCGHTAFLGDELVYLPEVEFQDVGFAKFTKRVLLIKLESRHVIKIPLDTVQGFVHSFQQTFTLTLSEQPSFYEDISESPVDDGIGDLELVFRQLGLAMADQNVPTRTRLCSLSPQHAKVIGQCLVYQIQVSGDDLQHRIASFKKHDMLQLIRYDLLTYRAPPLHLGKSHQAMNALMRELATYNQNDHLPFPILFQLQALAWNAFLHPGIVLAVARELRRTSSSRPVSVEAMKKLQATPWPMPNGDPSWFEAEAIIQYLAEAEDKIDSGETFRKGLMAPTQNLALIHRVKVTPTRITLHGPELEAMNRVLRKFPDRHEYFVRVQFCDENGQDLSFNPRISDENVYARFKSVFKNGFEIAGRTYSFLGWSHSSLRSHSAWFSAPFLDDNGRTQSYMTIIGDLGQFRHIRSPARCAARIGQAFSETPYYISLEDLNVTVLEVPDVERHGRVFSDGVCTVSLSVLKHVWDAIPQKKNAPTAIQIRFRGSKGMLALDSTLSGSYVCIRPSMKKFNSGDKPNLEICDMAAKPIALVLNRQMVKIMEDMGCNPDWFFKMQDIEIERLKAITSDVPSVAKFLKHKNVGDGIRLHRLFTQSWLLDIDYRKDDFLRSVVEAMVLRELRLLKHKARIPVQDGVTVFGILDETGFLKENEVYVTYDTMGGLFRPPPATKVPLLVTRSPALHPGDIQMARNSIPPEGHPLRDHYNVIAFSRQGNRDLPSQLSGGDLDGDIYNVIWDQGARPMRTFKAADYPRVDPIDLGREVTGDDMANFFVEFMDLDYLGVIATRHMILADQLEEGSLHEDCIKLAELHSTAVDFSKTGRGVNLRDLPMANRRRPDFLAPGPETRIVDKSAIELDDYILETAPDAEEDQYSSPRYEYYRSDKLLGRLYRAVDEQRIWHESVKSIMPPQGASFWAEFLDNFQPRYNAAVKDSRGWVFYCDTGREIREWYEIAMSDAMAQYSDHPIKPLTELEAFIGTILNKSGIQNHRQRDNSIKLRDEVDRITTFITNQMRGGRRIDESDGIKGTAHQTDNLHRCMACVQVGCEERPDQRGNRREQLQSFKIVAACAFLAELNKFEHGRRGGGFVGARG